jgi:DNA-binding CsgD family transcriptional regulator
MAVRYDAPLVCPILVGRERALGSLRALVGQAWRGSGRIALVTGEAGIGKSRLVAELKVAVRADGDGPAPTIVEGNCFEPDRTLPYAPLLDLLDRIVTGHTPTEISSLLGTTTRDLARLAPVIARVFPDAAPAADPDTEQEKRRLFQALTQAFAQLVTHAPLLVVIEDLHWCDDTSLEFFLYLARRIAEAPLLLLFTYRSDEIHPTLAHFLAMLDRERIATEYALARLTPPEAETMLRAIFGTAVRPHREVMERIYALTEGNPFFIEEIAKSLGPDAEDAASSAEMVHIPRSVHDAVRRRLAHLDAPARELLRVAAVAGRRFDFTLLHAVTGQDEATLLRAIKQLIAAQLVVEESADRFAFRHALTQQAVYGDLLARERRSQHGAIAATIARLYAVELDAHLADLAYHSYEAGAWAEALAYAGRVGERALALHAPRAAVEHFTRALGAAWQLSQTPPADLYRSRGLAYGLLGEFERARMDHETALETARASGDRRAECQSLLDLGSLWAGRDYQRAGDLFRQATHRASELEDAATHARSLNRLANWLVNTGRAAEALPVHQEALAIFTAADDARGMAETLDLLGMASGFNGAAAAAVGYYDRAIALARELDETLLLSHCLTTRAAYASPSINNTTWHPHSAPEQGATAMEEALRLARQAGWRTGEAYVHWQLAALHASYGMLGAALVHGEDALRIASESDHRQWMAAAHWTLAQAYVFLMLPEEAIAQADIGLPLAHDLGSAWWVALHAATLAQAHLLRGDAARAAIALDASLPQGASPRILPERRVAWMWGEVALAQRDPAGALAVADSLIASAPGPPNAPAIPWLAKLRGEALTVQGNYEHAERALATACIAATEQRALPLLWQVQRARGHLSRRWRRDERAEQAYAEARAVVVSLAKSVADPAVRTRFWQGALATMPRERAPSARRIAAERYGGLTARERDVAAEIARGKSNRAIAETLFVSERTVTTHITNILGKLALTSRAQIATWAVAHSLDTPDDAGTGPF